MSLTRRRVPLSASVSGWPDHERVPLGPSAGQDAGRLPQLQVVNLAGPVSIHSQPLHESG